MKKLYIFLTDPVQTFFNKGELKANYYNPGNLFTEIVMVSFTKRDIDATSVSFIAGNAKLKIISVGSLGIVSFFIAIAKIFILVWKDRPDVIRVYDPSMRGILSVIVGKIFKIPVIISLHCNLDEQRKYNHSSMFAIRRVLEKYSISRAQRVVCVTEHVADYARKYGARNPIVVYNRIDLKQFNPRNRKPIPRLILSVGRLDPQKNHSCIIKAIKDIEVNLLIIGQGSLYHILKRLVSDMGLDDRVEFIRSIQHREIHKYYAIAEIFAISTNYEGFCIPVLEAMASGTPVVASDIPPIREIGQGAVRLVENTPESFKQAFSEIMGNNKKIEEMSLNGIKIANERFDYHKLEQLEKLAYLGLK